jgi:hypothetical protein
MKPVKRGPEDEDRENTLPVGEKYSLIEDNRQIVHITQKDRRFKHIAQKVINLSRALKGFDANVNEIVDYIHGLTPGDYKNKVSEEYETYKTCDKIFSDPERYIPSRESSTASIHDEPFYHPESIDTSLTRESSTPRMSSMSSTPSMSSMSSTPRMSSTLSMSSTSSMSSSNFKGPYEERSSGKHPEYFEHGLWIGELGKDFKYLGFRNLFSLYIQPNINPEYVLCGLEESDIGNGKLGNYEPQYCRIDTGKLWDKSKGKVPYYNIKTHIDQAYKSTRDNPHYAYFSLTGHGDAKTPEGQNQIFRLENAPKTAYYMSAPFGNALFVSPIKDVYTDSAARQNPSPVNGYISRFVKGCDDLTERILKPIENYETYSNDEDARISGYRRKTIYSNEDVFFNKVICFIDYFSNELPKDIRLSMKEFRDFYANSFNFGLIIYNNSFGIPPGTFINIDRILGKDGCASVKKIMEFINEIFRFKPWDIVGYFDKTCNPIVSRPSDERLNRLVAREYDFLIGEINKGMTYMQIFESIVLPYSILNFEPEEISDTKHRNALILKRLRKYLDNEPPKVEKDLKVFLKSKLKPGLFAIMEADNSMKASSSSSNSMEVDNSIQASSNSIQASPIQASPIQTSPIQTSPIQTSSSNSMEADNPFKVGVASSKFGVKSSNVSNIFKSDNSNSGSSNTGLYLFGKKIGGSKRRKQKKTKKNKKPRKTRKNKKCNINI